MQEVSEIIKYIRSRVNKNPCERSPSGVSWNGNYWDYVSVWVEIPDSKMISVSGYRDDTDWVNLIEIPLNMINEKYLDKMAERINHEIK